jgi:N utilization substance protein B
VARRGTTNIRDRGSRQHGRELAFLVLCHLESYASDEREDAVALFWDNPPGAGNEGPLDAVGDAYEWVKDGPTRAFAERLVAVLLTTWDEIDALIGTVSRRWRIERMASVDRNVIRLVAAELKSESETPRGVVLAEAVRLAAAYGGERSASFVNGIAETLARSLRPTK